MDIINAFPDKRNPFFTGEDFSDFIGLLTSPVYSTERFNYFIKNYKDKLSFFSEEPHKSCLKDLDFLLRFWKQDDYKTKANLTPI